MRRLSRYSTWMQVTSVTSSATAAASNVSSSVIAALTRSLSPFDEPGRQPQPLAPASFRARHCAAIGLVIHAGQVQHAVQHQDAQFVLDAVAQLGGLRARRGRRRSRYPSGRKRQYVGGVVSCREILGSASAIPHPT